VKRDGRILLDAVGPVVKRGLTRSLGQSAFFLISITQFILNKNPLFRLYQKRIS
jgi:hypothetical protein